MASGDHAHEVIPLDEVDNADHQVDAAGLFHSGPDVSHFKLDVTELKELMEFRGLEAVGVIRDKYGGVHNICQSLYTSEVAGKCNCYLLLTLR